MNTPQWLQDTHRIFGADDAEKVSAYCRENWGSEVLHVLETADNACEDRFVFDFPWDMERTWKPMHFIGEIDWSLIPWGDREFLWQFNRHRFLPCLAQAYRMTGKEKYAENYVRLMEDWIDRAEEGENIDLGPWRTLETGIRAEMWLSSLPLVAESLAVDEHFLDKVERSPFDSIDLYCSAPQLNIFDYSLSDLLTLDKEIRRRHLSLMAMTPENCTYPVNFCTPERTTREASLRYYQRAIDTAAFLGCPKVQISTGFGYFDAPREEAWNYCRDSMQQLAAYCERKGVTLLLERRLLP